MSKICFLWFKILFKSLEEHARSFWKEIIMMILDTYFDVFINLLLIIAVYKDVYLIIRFCMEISEILKKNFHNWFLMSHVELWRFHFSITIFKDKQNSIPQLEQKEYFGNIKENHKVNECNIIPTSIKIQYIEYVLSM